MRAKIKTVNEIGSCAYCNRGELAPNNNGLIYPYDKVIEVKGYQVSTTLCFSCIKKLALIVEVSE